MQGITYSEQLSARTAHAKAKRGIMNADPIMEVPNERVPDSTLSTMNVERRATTTRLSGPELATPPGYLLDEIAREEWERVSAALFFRAAPTLAQSSLLAGYCTAVARAIRAEQTLALEGRYYETRTGGGSILRRRHPAVHDVEQGWASARRLAKQLGLIGGALGDQSAADPRRSLFK